MKIHALAGLITAGIGIGVHPALVAHVPQKMSARILRHRIAQMRTQPPVEQFAFLIAVALARDATHQHEAAAVFDLLKYLLEFSSEARQRKRLGREGNARAAALGMGQCDVDLRNARGVEMINPRRIVLNFRPYPRRRATDDFALHVCHTVSCPEVGIFDVNL